MSAEPVIAWLLEPAEPSLRYRTLKELLGRAEDDPETSSARAEIATSAAVKAIFARMQPEGYWRARNSRGEWVGEGVEYAAMSTTHYVLACLAELGMQRSDERVSRAAERYLNLMADDGDWLGHMSCLLGLNIRTFLRLGYRGDARLQRAVDLLERSVRWDGGCLCDMHAQRGKNKKSCIRGSLKALGAFAELGPSYWSSRACSQMVDYFLERGGVFRRNQPGVLASPDLALTAFPFTWRASLTEVLYSLSKMGYGKDERLNEAWGMLAAKRDELGRSVLDWTPSSAPLKAGKTGQANKWISLYALLARKMAG